MLTVRLGTIIPNAPANVGGFQFFVVLALGLFAVSKTTAAGFLTLSLRKTGLMERQASGHGFLRPGSPFLSHDPAINDR